MNRNIGGTLIISGTAIGASMVALPITSSPLGFIPSSVFLLIMWLLMAYSALVSLEVMLKFPPNSSVARIGEQFFGKFAKIISSASILLLFYSLLAAYISASSEIIVSSIGSAFDPNFSFIIPVVITFVFASIVCFSISAVDVSNRVLLAIKFAFFSFLVLSLLPTYSSDTLLYRHTSSPIPLSTIAFSIPVFFTSFGFHGSIPSVIEYMQRDHKKIRKALLLGSTIPLIVFLTWNIVVMGSLSSVELASQNVGEFIKRLSNASQSIFLPYVISGFSWMAIITSFLGVSISLFDFLMEQLKYDKNNNLDRIKSALVTFVPPFLISVLNPEIFVAAFGFAAISLCVIAIIIPVGCAIKMENMAIPGGKIGLWITMICGAVVILTEMFHLTNRFFN